MLGIDPFDQPNVEEAKELTRKRLARHIATDQPDPDHPGGWAAASDVEVPEPEVWPILAAERGIVLIPRRATPPDRAAPGTLVGELRRHLARRRPNAYLALQAFIAPGAGRGTPRFARIRALLRDRTRNATTAGYGPRFLHSTGQLHKGGPPTGWFLQLTEDHAVDLEIPGWPYTFGQLIEAQAEGDFAAIESHDLPILRVHLGDDPDAGLASARGRPRRGSRRPLGGLTPCASGSSASAGWAPTWSAACSATATRSSPTTGRPRRRGRSPTRAPRRRSRSRSSSRKLEKPRHVWIMVPAGDATEAQIEELLEHLEPGDTIIDGGNTNFHDDQRRHPELKAKGIDYVDAGVSAAASGAWPTASA